jgi:LuxR family maltose regulon positive regulatory protein
MEPHRNLEQVLGCRLVLVITSPGSGITSLLADWQSQSSRGRQGSIPITCLTLEAAHNSPLRFLDDLQSLLGVNGGEASGQTGAAAMTLEDRLVMMLNSTLNDTEDRIIVLENYQVIQEAEIHSAVAFMLDYLPARLHLVIASLEEPPLPIPRLRARRQILELRT